MKLARSLEIPPDAIVRTIAVLAQKGAGKTYLAMKLTELMLAESMQLVCLDPTGVWWGLKAAGKGAGFPIIIMGGDKADVPLEHASGKIVADFVTESGQSVVLDLSHFTSNTQQDQFVAEFAERLYRNKAHHKTPLHLMLDEADSFAPQNPRQGGWAPVMLGAIEAIVRRGRSRGLGMTMISQRPAVLNKNVLTQCDLLIAMRITGLQDHKALREWTRMHGTQTQVDKFEAELPTLPNGTAFFWSPEWLKCFSRHEILEKQTFDSSKTPEHGAKVHAPKFAAVNLDKLTADIQATVEKAKANDPRELKTENAKLRGKIIELDAAIVKLKDAATREMPKEISVFTEDDRQILRDLRASIEEANVTANGILERAISKAHDRPPPPQPERPRTTLKGSLHTAYGSTFANLPPAKRANGGAAADTSLPSGERAILTAAAQYQTGVTREQASILTGFKRSTRDAYILRLMNKGYLESDATGITATQAGVDALGTNFEPLPTGARLREYWVDRLPEGERKVLEEAISVYPNTLDRDSLEGSTGYKRSTRDAYILRLATKKLLDTSGRGMIRASDMLFD